MSMVKRTGPMGWALALGTLGAAPAIAGAPQPVAFVNVNVVPMDRERVLLDHTVIVRDGRIEVLGLSGETVVPKNAMVVKGEGRYLLPGLVESHAHLDSLIEPRPDFGDAPLFLAHGVTTVFNLRGEPMHLVWKRRNAEGSLLAPNLYNSGEFVNEPRVRTPDEVEQEVVRQKREGYDFIKYRQVIDNKTWETLTTVGLPMESYLRLNQVARREGMRVVGHAPDNLGLPAFLSTGQTLAHVGEFNILHFMPKRGMQRNALMFLGSFAILLLLSAAGGGAALVRWIRKKPAPQLPAKLGRALHLANWVLVVSAVAIACGLVTIPGGLLFGSVPVLAAYTTAAAFLCVAALVLLGLAIGLWRETGATWTARGRACLLALVALGTSVPLVSYWLPVAWRTTDWGIRRLTRACSASGNRVMSTAFMYQMAIDMSGSNAARYSNDPAFRYVPQPKRKRWMELGSGISKPVAILMSRYPEFTRKLLRSLHEEGVPLLAGTDVYGIPMLIPGRSLQQEIRYLESCGLTRYQALRAGTVEPARWLGEEGRFGTIAPGQRADLLLVNGNPLEDLAAIERLDGVMVRGSFLPKERLDAMLRGLTEG